MAELERGGRIAGLLTIAVAAIVMTAAFALDEWVRPPLWLHVVLWAPLTIGAVLFALRFYKVVGVYSAYEKRRGPSADRDAN